MAKIINGKIYSVVSFTKGKAGATKISKDLKAKKPLNKGDKILVKIVKLDGNNYAVMVHSIQSAKTKKELNNLFK